MNNTTHRRTKYSSIMLALGILALSHNTSHAAAGLTRGDLAWIKQTMETDGMDRANACRALIGGYQANQGGEQEYITAPNISLTNSTNKEKKQLLYTICGPELTKRDDQETLKALFGKNPSQYKTTLKPVQQQALDAFKNPKKTCKTLGRAGRTLGTGLSKMNKQMICYACKDTFEKNGDTKASTSVCS